MDQKVIGYLLLGGGLIVLLYSGFSVIQVFTGSAPPVQLFHLNSITYNPSTAQITLPSMELLPASTVNQFSNITAHIILMSFLAGVGFKIASLGVQLLRPVTVKLNKYTLESSEKSS